LVGTADRVAADIKTGRKRQGFWI